MKNLYNICLGAIVSILSLSSCSDWTDMEIKNPADLTANNRSEAYYAQLRNYKKSDHPVAFGWFGGWAGRSASLEKSLAGLPDSVDFVSLWGNWKNPTQAQKEDLKFVQEVKGTKVLICWQVHDIGDQLTPEEPADWKEKNPSKDFRYEFWGWGESNESHFAAVEKYANAILDTIRTYNYDGFDMDAEPFIQQMGFQPNEELWNNKAYIAHFVKVLSKELGPKSGTGKMLVVDGDPKALPDTLASYFDYFILQAYSPARRTNWDDLQNRLNKQYEHFKKVLTPEQFCKKTIITENFEDGSNISEYKFSIAKGKETKSIYEGLAPENMLRWESTNKENRWLAKSIIAFALWNPTFNGQIYPKGGLGTFHMEYEYSANGTLYTYPYLRKAIQLQNPRKK